MHSVMINSNFHLICVLMTAIHPESKYFELLTVGKCENALHYGAYQGFWPVPGHRPTLQNVTCATLLFVNMSTLLMKKLKQKKSELRSLNSFFWRVFRCSRESPPTRATSSSFQRAVFAQFSARAQLSKGERKTALRAAHHERTTDQWQCSVAQ